MKNYDLMFRYNSKLQIFTLMLSRILNYIQSSNLNLTLILTKQHKRKLSANSASKVLW